MNLDVCLPQWNIDVAKDATATPKADVSSGKWWGQFTLVFSAVVLNELRMQLQHLVFLSFEVMEY